MQISDYESLITSQHRDKPRFMAMVAAVVAPYVDMQETAAALPAAFDLDNAVGKQLDIIGEWVGLSRVLKVAVEMRFFGFDDTPNGLPFGEKDNPSVGGRFRESYELDQETTVLIDPEYRFALRAKIAANNTDGTLDSLQSVLSLIISGGRAVVDDHGDMTVSYGLGKQLTYNERVLVSAGGLLPKPAGVKLRRVVTFPPTGFFGFAGQEGALPFGEAGDPSIGGPFAEEIPINY